MRNLEISILELEHELGTVGVEVVHKGEEVSVAGDEGDQVVQSLGSRTGRGKFVSVRRIVLSSFDLAGQAVSS